MINGQKEIWISTGNKSNNSSTIIAVSNCGRIMRKNGKIEIASCRLFLYVGEKRSRILVYRFLAKNFIAKTEDDILKQRDVIDHITHEPTNMYINDVRNLRWCTQKENCNFEETKAKLSAALKCKTPWNKGKKHSEEVRAKISAAQKSNSYIRGRHWYNNGITNIIAKECPLGFTRGKLQKKKRS